MYALSHLHPFEAYSYHCINRGSLLTLYSVTPSRDQPYSYVYKHDHAFCVTSLLGWQYCKTVNTFRPKILVSTGQYSTAAQANDNNLLIGFIKRNNQKE